MRKIKKIIINSPKYGRKVILIDLDDWKLVKKFSWSLLKGKRKDNFYAITSIKKENKITSISMHRLVTGERFKITDHIDRNGLNNTKVNLREVTNSQNLMNSETSSSSTTGYKGVTYHKKRRKFYARITVNGKLKHIDYFDNVIDAGRAYNIAAKKHFGEFANPNKI